MNMFAVAIGGAFGAVARYLFGLLIMNRFPHPRVPVAMLFVNVLGSFGLGLFFGLIYGEIPEYVYDDTWFLVAGIGFFGAFTTFSTFSVETVELVRKGSYKKVWIYVSLSLLGSLLTFITGLHIGELL
ncbi:putative fluoride ion transporter CrcB 1 [Thalassobacillus devorans]|uniref:Fluoride-specific ion channel FluC n=1 Tax=Thalassobacillus devorans TaxID=279813 RepID=A0ABQ1PSQ4_9BACI|nr:fluoride efflux transporter CrcB [Thalassobacillus devorans]NIK30629.1 CrcB protein [Thalassobacillus devorans]GGD02523.1 putative fluoride ion transporter CrcB 1 [Thalassobacillus devorans]